jgi:hypothetical protein
MIQNKLKKACEIIGLNNDNVSSIDINVSTDRLIHAIAKINLTMEQAGELMMLCDGADKPAKLTPQQWQEMDASLAKMQDAVPRNDNPCSCEDLRKELSSIVKILKTQFSEGAPNQPKPMPDNDHVAQTVTIMEDEFKKHSAPWQKQDFDVFHKIVSDNNKALEALQDNVKSIKIPKPDYCWLAIASLVANGALVIFILSKMVSQ